MGRIIYPFQWVLEKVYYFLLDLIQATGVFDKGTEFVLAVILLTILVRLLILPLNIKQMRSSMKMQELQPEIQKLQNKYKNDPQKLQEKTMQLYKDNNASMFGGCLPLLIQLPILWALYGVFMGITGMRGTSFLWLKDLSQADNLYILPILSAATTYISSLMMTKSQPTQQGAAGASMQTMNIVMSLMMGFMAINFPSMLVLYWVIGNLIQMVQTYFIYTVPAKKKAAEKEALEVASEKNSTKDNQKKSNKKIKNK